MFTKTSQALVVGRVLASRLEGAKPILTKLGRFCLWLGKWVSAPFWGPVWIMAYLARVLLAALLGRRTQAAQQRRDEAKQRRIEATAVRRSRRPRLTSWFGLLFFAYLIRRFLGGTVNGFLAPLLLARFLLRRLWEAKAYVDDRKEQKLRLKAYLEEEERQREREAIQRAEQERHAKFQDYRRREEANRILEALRSF